MFTAYFITHMCNTVYALKTCIILSVSLSVCLSVTLEYCIEMAEPRQTTYA